MPWNPEETEHKAEEGEDAGRRAAGKLKTPLLGGDH